MLQLSQRSLSLRLPAPARIVAWTLVLVVVALAGLHGLITLSTILSSRLDYPMHDEFRINLRYLEHPFPLNVLLLENGHRTIFPGLARLVDLHEFGGRNLFQIAVAWSLAACAFALWMGQAFRSLERLQATASIALILAFVCWNAQTRMFIHAYETSHILYTFFGLTLTLTAMLKSARHQWPLRWLLMSLAGAVFAMFSFGPGVAVFGALFVVLWLRRAPTRILLITAITFVICLMLYSFLLPGAEGVRNSTRAFQFAAAPFLFFTRLGSPLHEILTPLFGRDHPAVVLACMLTGVVLCVLIARTALRIRLQRESASEWDVLVLGTFIFAAAANFVIVIGRSDYLMEHTTQLFADRYLFWGSLTWMAFSLQLLTWAQRGQGRSSAHQSTATSEYSQWRMALALLGIALLLKSMLPIARDLNIWASAVRREVSLAAAAQFVGHRDDARLARIADAGIDVARAADARMRALRIGHYAGAPLVPNLAQPSASAQADNRIIAFKPRGDLPALQLARQSDGMVDVVLDKPHARPWRNRHLLVLDAQGRLLASGMLTQSHRGTSNRWKLGRPTHDWFEAYWLNVAGTPAWLVGERDGIWHPVAQVSWR